RRRVRLPARSVVEPGRGGAGDRSCASHRSVAARVRVPLDRGRYGGREDRGAAAVEARAGRRDPARRRGTASESTERRYRASAQSIGATTSDGFVVRRTQTYTGRPHISSRNPAYTTSAPAPTIAQIE